MYNDDLYICTPVMVNVLNNDIQILCSKKDQGSSVHYSIHVTVPRLTLYSVIQSLKLVPQRISLSIPRQRPSQPVGCGNMHMSFWKEDMTWGIESNE